MMVSGSADSIVAGQRTEEFAEAWRSAGGRCDLLQHPGGHHVPASSRIAKIEEAEARFFQGEWERARNVELGHEVVRRAGSDAF
jgi:predicted esterase